LRLLAVLGAAWTAATAADLEARLNSEGLRVSAPRLHFLQARTLERLKDGGTVAADLQLSIWVDSKSFFFRRAAGRFAISYDLWEEKFAVTRLLPSRRSITHLSAAAAEAWCVENLPVPLEGLAPERDFWIRLELRTEDLKDQPAIVSEPGISLTSLIEIFSRNARAQQPRWQLEAGPLRLANLRK
jgi:hypothetical protein